MFMKKNKHKENEFHQELLRQARGLINIDIGNYIYDNGKHLNLILHLEGNSGIDIYIYDNDFAVIDEYDSIEIENIEMERKLMLGHYHYEDLLWLIMNYKNEKKYMFKQIDEYISWKEQYLYEKDKKKHI